MMITVTLNGQLLALDKIYYLAELLAEQGFNTQGVAIAINAEFVPRSYYQQTQVQTGDVIQIVTAMQGG